MSASGQVDCLMIIYSRLFEVQPWQEVFIVPPIFHMDSLSTGLHWTPVHFFHSQIIPRFSITEVDWSPANCIRVSGLSCIAYLIKKKK